MMTFALIDIQTAISCTKRFLSFAGETNSIVIKIGCNSPNYVSNAIMSAAPIQSEKINFVQYGVTYTWCILMLKASCKSIRLIHKSLANFFS